MITAEKIQVYDRCSGFWDGLALTGTAHQKDLFEDNDDWYLLTNFYQDIQLINDKLAAAEYTQNALDKIKECCDNEACAILVGRIVS